MSTPDFGSMSIKRLRAWIEENPDHEDIEEAQDALWDAQQDAQYERDTFGEPEDTPALERPWWESP